MSAPLLLELQVQQLLLMDLKDQQCSQMLLLQAQELILHLLHLLLDPQEHKHNQQLVLHAQDLSLHEGGALLQKLMLVC